MTNEGAGEGRSWGLLGVPSSAAAHWPGQEKGPEALRAAGLLEALREAGLVVEDHGDLPIVRWRPHPTERTPHNVTQVRQVLDDTAVALGPILEAGQLPLVVGGECTLALALVSAVVRAGREVGLMYVDGGQDLMIPPDHPREPILDGMGVAHLLDLPGTADKIAGLGPRRPLLRPEQVVFFGYGDDEEDIHGLVPSARYPASEVATAPERQARSALQRLTGTATEFLVHFDVDVLDFFELSAADVPQHGTGLTLDAAMAALRVFVQDPGFAGLTVAEFNPDHADPDTAHRLVEGLASALA